MGIKPERIAEVGAKIDNLSEEKAIEWIDKQPDAEEIHAYYNNMMQAFSGEDYLKHVEEKQKNANTTNP